MRKIYSLVLLAAALLIGTNAWAVDVQTASTIGTRAELQTAIDGVTGTATVTLTLQNDFEFSDNKPIWLGTEKIDDPKKSIILDLNGHTITCTYDNTKDVTMFVLSHGELLIRNSNSTEAVIDCGARNNNSTIVAVYGSYRSSRWNDAGNGLNADSVNTRVRGDFSHLEIGKGVTLLGPSGFKGSGIVVDEIANGTTSIPYTAASNLGKTLKYHTRIHNKNIGTKNESRGYAYGVRVDVYGKINIIGSTGATRAYGIKTNGNLHAATLGDVITETQMNSSDVNYLINYNSNLNEHKLDTIDAPFVYVHNGSNLTTTDNSTRSAAVYASGYAKWLIEGHCEGNIGVSASSGEISINGAEIASTADDYTAPSSGGGVSGSGSAVVINSRDGYAGNTNVTISGNSQISAESGYAIEEKVTTATGDSKTESVVVTGGTLTGGDEGGAISVTTKDDNNKYVTTVYSGNISGNISGDEGTTLQDLLPSGSDSIEVHTTVVYDENGENPVTVISPGKDNTGWSATVASAGKDSIKWTGTSETISADLTISELEINKLDSTSSPAVPVAQTLTIGDNSNHVVVTIGKVILGSKAQIIVNPGSKLIITGSQGIYSTVEDNLILRANASEQATFVIGPSVVNNNQPKATVEYYTTCKKATTSERKWQRFTSPLSTYSSLKSNYSTLTPTPELIPGASTFTTWIQYYDEVNANWVAITNPNQLKAFTCYSWINNTVNGGITYTFKGNLQGNVANNIYLDHASWNYMGNAFIAPMHLKSLLSAISGDIDQTIYLWDMDKQGYKSYNITMLNIFGNKPGWVKEIPAMQTFIVKLTSGSNATLNVDYENTIYNYVTDPTNSRYTAAPTREMSNYSSVCLHVESENGQSDDVYVVESNNFSEAYDNGADAVKFMSEGMNFYVADDENLAMIATDNILGTILSLQTMEDINYTITLDNVRGEVYALRDNLTNAVVLMNEGATYNFTAQPNATLEGRFQIVSRQEMPTSVETIEENETPKAIYTVMGQYVGETTDWNNLPAGVYVVDGVKVIK